MNKKFLSLLILTMLVIYGCPQPGPVNNAPSITTVTSNPSTLSINDEVTLTAVASDPDGDTLTYTWSANNGILRDNDARIVTWIAPDAAGETIITVTVSDGVNPAVESSITLTVLIPISPVTNFAANEQGLEIRLTWENPISPNYQETIIRRSTTTYPITLTDGVEIYKGASTATTDTGLEAHTQYYYTIWAKNNSGEYSTSVTATETTTADSTVPASPTNVSANAISSSEITVSWDVVENTTEYIVERAIALSGPYAFLSTVNSNQTYYTDNSLTPSTSYYYRVLARNTYGDSVVSSPATATTNAAENAPISPSALTSSITNSSTVVLNWTDNATTETAYRVYRSTNGSAAVKLGTDLNPNTITYTDSTQAVGNIYTYTVRAVNSAGESTPSNSIDIDTRVPSDPINFSGVGATDTVTLSWDDVSRDSAYTVERSSSSTGPWTSISTTIATNSTSYIDTTVTTGNTYYYRLTATNIYGSSSSVVTTEIQTGLPTGVYNTSTFANALWGD